MPLRLLDEALTWICLKDCSIRSERFYVYWIEGLGPIAEPGIGVTWMHTTSLPHAAAAHKARNLRVFGSVARGEDQPDSDIDFLVDFEPAASLLDLVGLQQEIEALLGRRVDVVTPNGVSPFLRDRILSEARLL